MKIYQKNINTDKGVYYSPQCDVTEISPEGVLCASMQQLDEYDGEYDW